MAMEENAFIHYLYFHISITLYSAGKNFVLSTKSLSKEGRKRWSIFLVSVVEHNFIMRNATDIPRGIFFSNAITGIPFQLNNGTIVNTVLPNKFNTSNYASATIWLKCIDIFIEFK